MVLLELFQPISPKIQDLDSDDSQFKFSDSRKTRLTLLQINRLRKMNDMRNLEHAQSLETVQAMYGQPPAEDAGGGMPPGL